MSPSYSARKHQANLHYKKLPLCVGILLLMYSFSYAATVCGSSQGLLACVGKPPSASWNGFQTAARSRAGSYSDLSGLWIDWSALFKQDHPFISYSWFKGLSLPNLKVIDSSTVNILCEIFCGVGRKPVDDSTRMGGIKAHNISPVTKVIVDNSQKKIAHGVMKLPYVTVGFYT